MVATYIRSSRLRPVKVAVLRSLLQQHDGTCRKTDGRLILRFPARVTAMVTFNVGNDTQKQKFRVYKLLACKHSQLFDAAFNSNLIEGQAQTYDLDDLDPQIFARFVDWLYAHLKDAQVQKKEPGLSIRIPLSRHSDFLAYNTRRIKSNVHPQVSWSAISGASDRPRVPGSPSTGDSGDNSSPEYEEAVDPRATPEQLINLAKIWILGYRMRSPRFQNHIMEVLKAEIKFKPVVTTAWMAYAYETTLSTCPLRHFAMDTCLYQMTAEEILECGDELPHAMLVVMVAGLGLQRVVEQNRDDAMQIWGARISILGLGEIIWLRRIEVGLSEGMDAKLRFKEARLVAGSKQSTRLGKIGSYVVEKI